MGNAIAKVTQMFPSKSEPPKEILLTGNYNSGKTTILYKLKSARDEVETKIPTIGINIDSVNMVGADFKSWDLGGRSPMRSLYRHYYKSISGIVFVVDSSDKYELPSASDELRRMMVDDLLSGLPVLVICNKQDLPTALSPSQIAAEMGLSTLLKDRQHRVVGASATTDIRSITDALDWLKKEMGHPTITVQVAQEEKLEAVTAEPVGMEVKLELETSIGENGDINVNEKSPNGATSTTAEVVDVTSPVVMAQAQLVSPIM